MRSFPMICSAVNFFPRDIIDPLGCDHTRILSLKVVTFNSVQT